jgi:hypothetical protein
VFGRYKIPKFNIQDALKMKAPGADSKEFILPITRST